MYSTINFKTKKALKEAVANGEKVGVYQPNNIFNVQPKPNSVVTLSGPHFPEPHKWYATATLDADCNIVKVK